MSDHNLVKLLSKAVAAVGRQRVADSLVALTPRDIPQQTLTLVANAGVHTIPSEYLRGQVFEVSRGNWAAESTEEVHAELKELLSSLATKLRSQPWQRVYLIPTGHPILTANIKLLVYRLLRINSIDLYYRAGRYIEVELDHREIALMIDNTNDSEDETAV